MHTFTPEILRFESLNSTNLEAIDRATKGAPEATCVVAAEQTAGRGRFERRWVSPRGAGLYLSIVLRPELAPQAWPLITLMSAIAVSDALAKAYGVKADIKWPNDLLLDEKKFCGILAETVDTNDGRVIVVGMGVNLGADSFPPELESATSLEAALGYKPDLEVVLNAILDSFGRHYVELVTGKGAETIIQEWCAASSYCQGKRVRVTDGPQSFLGTTRGLQEDGALRVETDEGDVRIVRAADVTSVRALESSA
jgi:BirA family biotin operon repressor/biotin-[acetyl-CoA-carboxylase] ligase